MVAEEEERWPGTSDVIAGNRLADQWNKDFILNVHQRS
jgi:hypothetical protein